MPTVFFVKNLDIRNARLDAKIDSKLVNMAVFIICNTLRAEILSAHGKYVLCEENYLAEQKMLLPLRASHTRVEALTCYKLVRVISRRLSRELP